MFHPIRTPPLNNRIFKYQLPKQMAFTVEMPIGSQILSFGLQKITHAAPIAVDVLGGFPLWELQVVDKRGGGAAVRQRFAAQTADIARAHFEDLGFLVSTCDGVGQSAPGGGGTISEELVPLIWAFVPQVLSKSSDPDEDGTPHIAGTVPVRFISVPTGASVPDGNWHFIGTVQLPGREPHGEAVFHVFVDGTYVTINR